MKKLFFAAVAIVSLASCVKNEVRIQDQDVPITYKAVVGKALTKADPNGPISGAEYLSTYPSFGSYAYLNHESKNDLYIPGDEVVYNETAATWTTTPAYYWPKDAASTLTFYSYSPYSSKITGTVACAYDTGIKVTGYEVSKNGQNDLMVSQEVTTSGKNDPTNITALNGKNGVKTEFGHKLSHIHAITFQTVDASKAAKKYATGTLSAPQKGDKFFFVNSVTFNNIYDKADYTQKKDSKTDVWDNHADQLVTYTWFTQATNDNVNQFADVATGPAHYQFVLPQEFATDANITLIYTIRTYIGTGVEEYVDEKVTEVMKLSEVHTPDTGWAMNKKITYTIKISLDQIYWTPSVTDWDTTPVNGNIEK